MTLKIFFPLLLLSSTVFAQSVSVGIKGGVPLTDAFSDAQYGSAGRFFSDSKRYVIGAMVELRLPLGLGIEGDALYRPLGLSRSTFGSVSSLDVSSWEFPVLGKYRFPFPIVKPYIEAGPSFRHVGGSVSYLSKAGFALGGGVEVKLLKVRLSPELRYTRWGRDGVANVSPAAVSNVNQAEFLVGISF